MPKAIEHLPGYRKFRNEVAERIICAPFFVCATSVGSIDVGKIPNLPYHGTFVLQDSQKFAAMKSSEQHCEVEAIYAIVYDSAKDKRKFPKLKTFEEAFHSAVEKANKNPGKAKNFGYPVTLPDILIKIPEVRALLGMGVEIDYLFSPRENLKGVVRGKNVGSTIGRAYFFNGTILCAGDFSAITPEIKTPEYFEELAKSDQRKINQLAGISGHEFVHMYDYYRGILSKQIGNSAFLNERKSFDKRTQYLQEVFCKNCFKEPLSNKEIEVFNDIFGPESTALSLEMTGHSNSYLVLQSITANISHIFKFISKSPGYAFAMKALERGDASKVNQEWLAQFTDALRFFIRPEDILDTKHPVYKIADYLLPETMEFYRGTYLPHLQVHNEKFEAECVSRSRSSKRGREK